MHGGADVVVMCANNYLGLADNERVINAARAALDAKSRAPETAATMDAKLTTGRFYIERILPETALRLARISTGADTMMSLPAEMF